MTLNPGGYPMFEDGEFVGAIGVGGGSPTQDDDIARLASGWDSSSEKRETRSESMSQREIIKTDGAPNPTGPFNQAVRVGNLVFTSGQAGRNRETGKMGDVREQTDWSLRNLDGVLRAAGSSLDDAVKVTVTLKDGVDIKRDQ